MRNLRIFLLQSYCLHSGIYLCCRNKSRLSLRSYKVRVSSLDDIRAAAQVPHFGLRFTQVSDVLFCRPILIPEQQCLMVNACLLTCGTFTSHSDFARWAVINKSGPLPCCATVFGTVRLMLHPSHSEQGVGWILSASPLRCASVLSTFTFVRIS